MAILLAIVAAVGWGASDYFGGDVSRREVPVFVIVAIAQLLGVLLLVPVLVARGVPPPDNPRLLLGALAGVSVTVELSLIYRALGRGEAFITAPTGALGAAAAVTFGLIGGDPIGPGLTVGLACALSGSAVTARSPGGNGTRSPSDAWRAGATCLAAAAAVGTTLTALHAAGRVDPYWATATEHVSTALSAGAAAAIAARGRLEGLRPRRSELPTLALVAAVGLGGDLAYASASRGGALSIVAAISSLYPVTTIALGRLLQCHRPTRIQLAGIALALGGAAVLGAATG